MRNEFGNDKDNELGGNTPYPVRDELTGLFRQACPASLLTTGS